MGDVACIEPEFGAVIDRQSGDREQQYEERGQQTDPPVPDVPGRTAGRTPMTPAHGV